MRGLHDSPIWSPCIEFKRQRTAAIYSSRELALPGDLFRVLSSVNHAGALSFGCALGGLFLMYPKPFVRPRTLLWIPAVFGAWLVADVMRWAPDQNWGSRLPVLLQLLLAIAFGLLQWRRSRHQPLDRAALRWFALSSLVGCSLFVLTVYAPAMLGWFAPLPQAYAFGFFLFMYAGIALGLRRYRLFDLDEWAYRVLVWLAGAIAVVVMDATLLLPTCCGNCLILWKWSRARATRAEPKCAKTVCCCVYPVSDPHPRMPCDMQGMAPAFFRPGTRSLLLPCAI